MTTTAIGIKTTAAMISKMVKRHHCPRRIGGSRSLEPSRGAEGDEFIVDRWAAHSATLAFLMKRKRKMHVTNRAAVAMKAMATP